MSNDIRTGGIPVSITSNNSHKNSRTAEQGANLDTVKSGPPSAVDTDTVSMTEKASRLQEIENMLAAIPPVNDALVAEIGQAIADGSIEINLERIAANLIEMETGVLDRDKS